MASLYINRSPSYTQAGHPPADICINGLVVATPEEWDKMLVDQRPVASGGKDVRYVVEVVDAHIINPDFRFAAPPELLTPNPSKRHQGASSRLMIMVTVSGKVVFGHEETGNKLNFNDVFRLVPNWEAIAKHGKGWRRFLIAGHTYRAF